MKQQTPTIITESKREKRSSNLEIEKKSVFGFKKKSILVLVRIININDTPSSINTK